MIVGSNKSSERIRLRSKLGCAMGFVEMGKK